MSDFCWKDKQNDFFLFIFENDRLRALKKQHLLFCCHSLLYRDRDGDWAALPFLKAQSACGSINSLAQGRRSTPCAAVCFQQLKSVLLLNYI